MRQRQRPAKRNFHTTLSTAEPQVAVPVSNSLAARKTEENKSPEMRLEADDKDELEKPKGICWTGFFKVACDNEQFLEDESGSGGIEQESAHVESNGKEKNSVTSTGTTIEERIPKLLTLRFQKLGQKN